jgi:predicted nucleic acid-binding protein
VSLVVDASVAYKWFVNERGSTDAVALRTTATPLIAPDLIVSEVCNSAWKSFRRGQLDAVQCGIIATAIGRSLAWLAPSAPLATAAMRMATALDHPIYDCLYLALAEREGIVLVTADQRLIGRVLGTPYAALARPLA